MSGDAMHSKGGEGPQQAGIPPSQVSEREVISHSPSVPWWHGLVARAASAGSMALFICATVHVFMGGPYALPLSVAAIACTALAATVIAHHPNRVDVLIGLAPLFLALVAEYALAFGTLATLQASGPDGAEFRIIISLHYPSALLTQLLDNDTDEGGIAAWAITQWLLMALLIYLVRWGSHRRRIRDAIPQP